MKRKRLMVWTGPVSSAKSTAAHGMANRFKTMGLCVVLVRPLRSVRGHEAAGEFRTKNGAAWPSYEVNMPWKIISEVLGEQCPQADVVWIDEPALFEFGDLFEAIEEIRRERIVMVSGIAATSELEPFGASTPRLLAVADEIIQCYGDCHFCGGINIATRTLYLGSAPKDGQVLVGGEDVYQPACVHCWNELIELDSAERRDWRGRLVRANVDNPDETV